MTAEEYRNRIEAELEKQFLDTAELPQAGLALQPAGRRKAQPAHAGAGVLPHLRRLRRGRHALCLRD